jgi:hypothetical protein
VGVVDVGGGTSMKWTTIYLRRPGPPPPIPPRLTGGIPSMVKVQVGGAIPLTLRFTRSGSVTIELAAYPNPSPIAKYRHTSMVRKGTNHLVLQTRRILAGTYELLVVPLPDAGPHSSYYRREVTVTRGG